MTKRILAVLLLGLAACGDDGGSGGVDASAIDAAPIPAMVTVRGVASTVGLGGSTPLADVKIEAFREGETTAVAMAMSGADGTYTITIPTGGVALDGYLKGTQSGKKDNYLYPPKPITADIPSAPVLMVTQGIFDTLGTLAQTNQDPAKAFVGVQVFTADNMDVAGAVVTSSPAGTVKYNGSNGRPTPSGMMTEVDGIAYIFNVNPGTVTISATGGGLTFFSHPVNARAGQLTTTLIQP